MEGVGLGWVEVFHTGEAVQFYNLLEARQNA